MISKRIRLLHFDTLKRVTKCQLKSTTRIKKHPILTKLYIQSYAHGGGVEFNADYTRIRKFEIPEEALKAIYKCPNT